MTQQRIEQIKGYLGMMAMLHDNGDAGDALEIIEQLEEEIAQLRAALCFYSNDSTYSMSIIDKDRGDIARQALKGVKP